MEVRRRAGGGHGHEGDPRATTDIRHLGPCLEPLHHPGQSREHARDEDQLRPPRSEPLDAVRATQAEIVVAEPPSSAKRLGRQADGLGCRHISVKGAGGEPCAVGVVRQHLDALGRQLEVHAVGGLEQARSPPGAEPLEEPPRIEARARRELIGGEGSRPSHGLVQAQPVSQVDHESDDLSLLVAPYPQGEGRRLLLVHRPGVFSGNGPPRPAQGLSPGAHGALTVAVARACRARLSPWRPRSARAAGVRCRS